MDELLDAIATLVSLVSPEKVQAIATRARQTEKNTMTGALSSVVGTPMAATVVAALTIAWKKTSISQNELASMLLAASHVYTKVTSEQTTELVWTGPTTPFVSARRTEQVLLQVINSSTQDLLVTSFVAYDVSTIIKALNAATARGVAISILLELSNEHGGSISFDVICKIGKLVPAARLYAWREKTGEFLDGRVHAKVAVADGDMCFITSANLTGHAMEKNMEAGVLISGGELPKLLRAHLKSLLDLGIVSEI